MKCPYCQSTGPFTDPVPVCSGMPEGIPVPTIRQCQACRATLSPAGFTPGTPEFSRARSMRLAALAPAAATA
jgi:hypothetical protein